MSTETKTEIRNATLAASFSLQCFVLLNGLDRGTGFHAFAARRMAESALTALDAAAGSEDSQEVEDCLCQCADFAQSSGNILVAYLKGANASREDCS